MKLIPARFIAIVLSFTLSYFIAFYFGILYGLLSSGSLGGSFVSTEAAEWIAGFPLALIFLVTFSIHMIGGRKIWWWTVIPLLPVIIFEVVFDPFHIYFPIILGLIAWGLGTLAHKTLKKLAPSFMGKMG